MMTTTSIRHARKPSEEGYMLVVVVFLLAILMLSLTVAAPVIKKEIQRDREVETMHRGKQYARAVKLYYKKFGAYPPTVDALVKQNEIRFLRRKYIDPTTGKEDWKIIRVGQQKTQTLGFFGQTHWRGRGPDRDTSRRFEPWRIEHHGRQLAVWLEQCGDGHDRPKCHNWRGSHGDNRQCDRPIGRHGGWDGRAGQPAARVRAAVLAPQPVPGCPADIWRRTDHWLFTQQPQAVHPGLQEEEPLQRMGVYLRPACRSDDAGRQHRGHRPAGQQHDNAGWYWHPHWLQPQLKLERNKWGKQFRR